MFINQDKVEVIGKVFSGLGEGKKYVLMPEYNLLLSDLLGGKKPYPGTLNVELLGHDYEYLVRFCRPRLVKTRMIKGKIFGGFYYWYADLMIIKNGGYVNNVLVIRPLLSRHSKKVVEVISDIGIRNTYFIRDGDLVKIIIRRT